MAPLIFGTGTGPVNRTSMQVPHMVRTALAKGQAEVMGEGTGVWSHIHVEDLALLYEIILQKAVLLNEDIPQGKRGIYFATSGDASWLSIAESIGIYGAETGKLSSSEVRKVSVEEGAPYWVGGSESLAEIGFCSK